MRRTIPTTAVLSVLAAALAGGCSGDDASAAGRGGVLRLAVTTSTRDSGLLDVLVPVFEERHGVRVDVVAVGTGAALKQGENGNVDAVLAHARKAEDAFLAAGHGVRREDVMENTFEVLGPPSDPARIRGQSATQALRRIAGEEARFVSRGDDSGTHQRELELWQRVGRPPTWDDYVESGQGMGATLTMADEMRAYTLSDRGTYLRRRDTIELEPLAAQSEQLRNPYAILVVDPAKHECIREDLANAFADFIISREAQEMIRDYTVGGEALFHPVRLD